LNYTRLFFYSFLFNMYERLSAQIIIGPARIT